MKHVYQTAEMQLIVLSEKDLIRMSGGESNDSTETENGDVELPKVPLG